MNFVILFTFIFYILLVQFGLLVTAQLFIWTLVLLGSNLIVGINPDNFKFKIVRIMAIIAILLILFVNVYSDFILIHN